MLNVASRYECFKASRISGSPAQSMRIYSENGEGKDLSVTLWKESTFLVDGNDIGFVCYIMDCVRLSRHIIHIRAIELEGQRRWVIKSQIRAIVKLYELPSLSSH